MNVFTAAEQHFQLIHIEYFNTANELLDKHIHIHC